MQDKPYQLNEVANGYEYDRRKDTFSAPAITLGKAERGASKSEKEEDVPTRGKWGKSIQSLLLCISMSVGLGNVWRFPNVAYNNGGGAFLIPYLLLLVIIGRPLYYLELILGQFSSQGPIKLWRVVPAFKGIGYAQVLSVSFVVVFYNYLMALSIFYIYSSMRTCLPWTECNYPNLTTNSSNMTPAEYFWRNEVLEEDPDNPDTFTHISWKLAVCLLITWTLVYISVVQGTDSLGKMAYFTAIFPYVVLTALLIVALQEEGSLEGIKFFFKPELSKLKEITVWYRACEQSFFSLAIGYGNIVMIASYNKFTNNVYRDAIIISLLDTFTNVLAGSVIFAVLGTLAFQKDLPIDKVVNHQDLGLAFIIYPQALADIKIVPQLWSTLFFVMLFTLGIGSSMSQIETILTVIKDKFPNLRERKGYLALGVSVLFFSLGLPLTTNVGQHILVLLNNYGVGAAVYVYATLTVIGITWIYGIRNFSNDVRFMLGSTPGIFWKTTWTFTAPVALTIIFIYGNLPQEDGPKNSLPLWAEIAGWVLAAAAVFQIPIWGVYVIYRNPEKTLMKKLRSSFKATKDWGPSDPDDKKRWLEMKRSPEEYKEQQRDVMFVSAVYNESFEGDVF
ncbi:sodium-dependent nutrient amino acid transporter 1-like [Argiope bruennichi]|uniref:sodium-dependent nutrient amino acid transporter 1-like n=1 Tax=Argiope bruennichi TaxID=94029 RepID=UPI002494C46A|nr:sodium-dependent nutrient amino acid transporter 1-like [Argiope bruennichi]